MLFHFGTENLTGERVHLRRFTSDDAPAVYNNWASDFRVTEFLKWQPHENVESTAFFLKQLAASYDNLDYYDWGIEYDGVLVGSIGVVRRSENDELCEIGYCLGYDWWGRGIMTEALSCVSDYLFNKIGFNRIELNYCSENFSSGRVAEKCGFCVEGIQRSAHKLHDGSFSDVTLAALLKKDFCNRV